MPYLDNITFQYYPADIEKCKPIGEVTIREFIESHRNPKQNVLETFSKIESASKEGNLKLKAQLKKTLYYFTPSAKFKDWRKYENITEFNGLIQIDFDKILNAEIVKKFLFETFDCCVCAYLSPSRLGCKALFRIPICKTVEEFKSYVYGLFSVLERLRGFDPAPKNCALPLFLSYDENILWRENPTEWTLKGIQENEFDMNTVDPYFEASEDLSKEKMKDLAQHIKNTVNLADKLQVGHKHVVGASLLAGGVCAQYKNINQDKLWDYLIQCIEESDYLQKGLYGYKKTAKTMFNKGLLSPIEYKNND